MKKLVLSTKKAVVPLLPLLLILSFLVGCAARGNPNLTPTTTWNLNVADQLQQLERDYKTIFTDAGNAQRQGILTAANISTLNIIGNRLKPAMEKANQAFKIWQANPTDTQKQIVIQLLTVAQGILAELSMSKTQMVTAGGAK